MHAHHPDTQKPVFKSGRRPFGNPRAPTQKKQAVSLGRRGGKQVLGKLNAGKAAKPYAEEPRRRRHPHAIGKHRRGAVENAAKIGIARGAVGNLGIRCNDIFAATAAVAHRFFAARGLFCRPDPSRLARFLDPIRGIRKQLLACSAGKPYPQKGKPLQSPMPSSFRVTEPWREPRHPTLLVNSLHSMGKFSQNYAPVCRETQKRMAQRYGVAPFFVYGRGDQPFFAASRAVFFSFFFFSRASFSSRSACSRARRSSSAAWRARWSLASSFVIR